MRRQSSGFSFLLDQDHVRLSAGRQKWHNTNYPEKHDIKSLAVSLLKLVSADPVGRLPTI